MILFVLSCIYFVGLVVTAIATGHMTSKPQGFLLMGLGTVLYAIAIGIASAFFRKS